MISKKNTFKNSKVILVGAGPGDAELITLKGINAIAKADVVLYDALVNNALLKYAKPEAELIFVGKRRELKQYSQDEINRLLVSQAVQNKIVVRLKGGDPFVFGRGTEELNYVEDHGIETEIIPGISSALAVPVNQGIPLTKRGINESFHVITGTTSNGKVSGDLKFGAMSSATLIILMGLKNFTPIIKEVLTYRSELTPFSIIQNGTLKKEAIILDTLSNHEKVEPLIDYSKPGIIVIGDTVAEHPSFYDEEIQRVLQASFME